MFKNCGFNSQQGSMAAKIRDNAGKQSIMQEQDERQQDHEVSSRPNICRDCRNVVTNLKGNQCKITLIMMFFYDKFCHDSGFPLVSF